MKQNIAVRPPRHNPASKAAQAATVGPKGIALAPLTYGIAPVAHQPLPMAAAEQDKAVSLQPEQRTGLPDKLKAGIEHLSGLAMDDVRVHYNSAKPAQLQAYAYTQGTEIHVAPGQERHLPHEAWHVVQQKQGRVKPRIQMRGMGVNDDTALEKEAEHMGRKSLVRQQVGSSALLGSPIDLATARGPTPSEANSVVQRYSIIQDPVGQLAEDKNVIVTKQKSLFATEERIKDSNKQLALAGPHGAMIKLAKTGDSKKTAAAAGKDFYKVKPVINYAAYHARLATMPHSFHHGLNKQGDVLEIWADCRRASEVVTGASSSPGLSDREVKISGGLSSGYSGGINRPSKIANDNSTARLAFQVYASQIGPFITQHGPKVLSKKPLYHLFPELANISGDDQVLEWLEKKKKEAVNDISVAERLYASLTATAKDEFHKQTGTNAYANPEIGDAYSTVTEFGMPGFKESGDDWAFHWGGVVMKGGSDNITLENLSVSNETVRNKDWFFAMYGTTDPKQSFHSRQMATGHHGNIATTITAVTMFSPENRKLQGLYDEVDRLRQAEVAMGVDYRVPLLKAAVDYNQMAESINKEPLSAHQVLGTPDREFTTTDEAQIHPLKSRYIPR